MNRVVRLLLLAPLLAVAARGQEASFSGIGFLPRGEFSNAWAVSADGRVVVGQGSGELGGGAIRWEDDVMELLDGFGNIAFSVSADGRVVVGFGPAKDHPPELEAFRWEAGTMIRLGDLPGGGFESIAWDVSGDGSVVVGNGEDATGQQPFRWEDGTMEELPQLPGHNGGNAYGISADGRVIAGYGGTAVRWVDGVVEALPPPNFQPWDISADGSVIVGNSDARSYIWREGQGTTEIPQISPGAHTQAHAVSGDGQVVAGVTLAGGAFIWTEATGTMLLKQVLEELYGLDLTGWSLSIVWYNGVNGDGTVIVGEGINPDGDYEGWRAVLPPWPVAGAPEVLEAGEPVLSVYPNPFYHQTTFRFSIPGASHVSLKVFDILGRNVATLLDQHHEPGNVTFLWVAADDFYRPLASGVYFYQLRVGDEVETGRMTLID